MNRLVIPLMLGLIAIARCQSTATLTSIYTGSGFLPFATFYGSDPIYIEEISEKVSKIILKTNSLDINSLNATDFQCSLSKQVCLLAIDFLVSRPDEAEKMGKNGRQAVLTRYNWAREEIKLVKFYDRLLAS